MIQRKQRGAKKDELTRDMIQSREELTLKLRDGNILPYEAQKLKEILEIERERAEAIGDVIAIGAILFLLGAVIALSESKKKSKKRRLWN
jgi:hypothetical protein